MGVAACGVVFALNNRIRLVYIILIVSERTQTLIVGLMDHGIQKRERKRRGGWVLGSNLRSIW